MSRKLWKSALAIGLAAVSAGALADHNSGYRYDDRDDRYGEYDYARVTGVEPLRRRVRISEPVRECWDEVSYAPDRYSDRPLSSNHVGGTLVGALIGGVLGNQIGSGSGRRVARAAGAIIGGAVGNNVSRQRERERYGDERYGDGRYRDERVVQRCETHYRDSYEERIDGYDVTYVYAGREYRTRMPYDPGDRIRIRVDVTPTGG